MNKPKESVMKWQCWDLNPGFSTPSLSPVPFYCISVAGKRERLRNRSRGLTNRDRERGDAETEGQRLLARVYRHYVLKRDCGLDFS